MTENFMERNMAKEQTLIIFNGNINVHVFVFLSAFLYDVTNFQICTAHG